MGCDCRPEIITNWEPSINGNLECKKYSCKLKDISYDASGILSCYNSKGHFKDCTLSHSFCARAKRALQKSGYVTQADADYYALKLLENHPVISQSISHRFPVIFVDEAQDTSEIQMKILEELLNGGLERIMLIGDPNQAIYEWRIANPHVFLEKMDQWGSLPLNENWRSSKKLCKFTDRLLDGNCKSIPMNKKVANYNFDPLIWGYDRDKPLNAEASKLINRFLDLCSKHDIERSRDSIAVLVRGKNMINEIINGSSKSKGTPWREEYRANDKIFRDKNRNHYANIALSKYNFDRGEIRDAFRLFERTISAVKLEKEYISANELCTCYKDIGLKEWRKRIFKLLTDLPQTNMPLGKWIELANIALTKHRETLNINDFQIKIKQSKVGNRYDEANFKDIFGYANEEERYTIGTVHSIKGREFEAVLLILKEKSANKNYSNIINSSLADEEEMRIVYVAITRPKKILVLAVPECDRNIWHTKFSQKNLFDF